MKFDENHLITKGATYHRFGDEINSISMIFRVMKSLCIEKETKIVSKFLFGIKKSQVKFNNEIKQKLFFFLKLNSSDVHRSSDFFDQFLNKKKGKFCCFSFFVLLWHRKSIGIWLIFHRLDALWLNHFFWLPKWKSMRRNVSNFENMAKSFKSERREMADNLPKCLTWSMSCQTLDAVTVFAFDRRDVLILS